MNKLKEWWAKYRSTGGSQVIWAARLQAAAGFVWMVVEVSVQVLHDNLGLVSSFTSNPALVAEVTFAVGILYEILRRYKAEDL